MSDIARAFPAATIRLHTMSPWHRLFQQDERYDRVGVLDLKGEDRGLRRLPRFAKMVECEAYDVVFDFQPNDRSRLAIGLSAMLRGNPRYWAGCHRLRPYNIVGPSTAHGAGRRFRQFGVEGGRRTGRRQAAPAGRARCRARACRSTPASVGPDEIDECQAIVARDPTDIVNRCGETELLELLPIWE